MSPPLNYLLVFFIHRLVITDVKKSHVCKVLLWVGEQPASPVDQPAAVGAITALWGQEENSACACM